MKLPNLEQAIIDPTKIRDYCLNPDHPRGKHKARVFKLVLGLTSEETENFITQVKNKIAGVDCRKGKQDEYGQRYIADIEITNDGQKAVVRTIWIIKRNEVKPRLTTCYVK